MKIEDLQSLSIMVYNAAMRIDEIVVFVKVLDLGSFAAAARELGMPATTVSARIAALEKRLGASLIRRTTRSLSPTDEGHMYYLACRASLAQLEEAEAALAQFSEEPHGTLTITAPTVIGRSALPRLIGEYSQNYKSVKIRTIITDRKVDLVNEGIDLAIRVGPLKDSSMIAQKISTGEGGFYASRNFLEQYGKPQTIDDLGHFPTIGFSRDGSLTSVMQDGQTPVAVTLNSSILTDDFYTCRSLISMGFGVGYLPSIMAAGDDPSSDLIRVLPHVSTSKTEIYILYPKQNFIPARLKSFVNFTRKRNQYFSSAC